jgi:hypothetical protein
MKKKSITQTSSTDVKPYLLPILLTGEIKKRFNTLMSKIVGYDMDGFNMYLQNKLTDPALHSNDYLKFEEPCNFKFEYLFTTCKGVYLLENMTSSSRVDDDLFNANEAFLNEAKEIDEDNEGIEIDCDLPELPEIIPSFEENLDEDQNEDENEEKKKKRGENDETILDEMKIYEVMSHFKSNQCERIKDGICNKQHYIIGIGDVVIGDKTYSGVHIYLYPDKNYDQVDVPEENINDIIYLQCQENKLRHKKRLSPKKCEEAYLEKFNQLLIQFDYQSIGV